MLRQLTLICMAILLAALPANAAKPNIVFVLADDMGYEDVSAYNSDGKIPPPNIDRLGRERMRFIDAHTNASVCTPTRYEILTGRYCWRTENENGVLHGHRVDSTLSCFMSPRGAARRARYRSKPGKRWSQIDMIRNYIPDDRSQK